MVFIVYHTQRIGYLLLTSLKKYVSSEIVIFITILYKGIFKLHFIQLKFDIRKINFPATCFKNKKKLLNRIWRKYHWTLNRGLNSHLAFPKIYLQIILISCHVHEFINVNATFWLDAIPIFFLHLLNFYYSCCPRIPVSKWWPFPFQSCCLHASVHLEQYQWQKKNMF